MIHEPSRTLFVVAQTEFVVSKNLTTYSLAQAVSITAKSLLEARSDARYTC
jgi:hypothetical protein